MSSLAPPAVGSVWINTPSHSWADLRGVPTVLLFWSIGCDASTLMLRRLEKLQRQFGSSVQVIAVHSPRTEAAQPIQRVLDAVARLRLSLPVLHDPQLETFGRYSPGGWPACVFIDNKQRVKGVVLGSDAGSIADITTYLGAVPAHDQPRFRVGFQAPRRPIEFAWPSGVVALDRAGLVAVSDEGNNRIILGAVDAEQGIFASTAVVDGISRPGRLAALPGGSFVVTQPDDGTVSLVDPDLRMVYPLATDLDRPVGLCVDLDGSIVVADAGSDQLLRIDADAVRQRTLSKPSVIAGSGFTGQNDGRSSRATLSQPNAVCRTTTGILFVDAASNNVRLLTDKGRVHSVTQNSPTRYGLADGPAHAALLNRPVDLVGSPDGSIIVVDQQNNRIRRLADQKLTTLGASGLRDPEAATVLSDGSVLVADTSNHRIVHIDTRNRTARGLRLDGMERTLSLGAAPTVKGNAGMPLTLGYPSPGSGPWEVEVKSEPAGLLVAPLRVRRQEPDGEVVVNLGMSGRGVLTVTSVSSGDERSIRLPLEVR
ncbi:MAG: redoxin domain-containing protein [Acidimicrobiales bacterium]